jgi:hypothetical protein
MHCDKHVVKMIVETAQLLCGAHHMTGSWAQYKLSHKNHPCAIWTRESIENYIWLSKLGVELCREYTRRYNKIHKSEAVINWCVNNIPALPHITMTEFRLAMPDICKITNDPVENYREYYIREKHSFCTWKTNVPEWFN